MQQQKDEVQRTEEDRLRRWVERWSGCPVEAVRRWDRRRRRALDEEDLLAAAHASIVLVLLLARLSEWACMEAVVAELRRTARRARRHGEVVFALYRLTDVIAPGADLEEAAAEALARLRRLAAPPEPLPAAAPWLRLRAVRWEGAARTEGAVEITVSRVRPMRIELPALGAAITLHGETPGTTPGASASPAAQPVVA